MRVNLNKMPHNTFKAASPPPLPAGIKVAAKKFSVEDWEDFFFLYWAHHLPPNNEHLIRDVSKKASLGLRSPRISNQLDKHGRKY